MRILAVLLPGPLALLVALATADGVDLPWLLLGTRLEADATGQVFLLLAAVVWTVAGLALGPVLGDGGVAARRLASFGTVALLGNLGVAVAQDAVSFYTCFSAMSLATYGLVSARADRAGRRAGRLYIAMAVAAEALLLAGLVLAVRSAGSLDLADIRAAVAVAPERDLLIALLLVGFGVKAGMLGVHAWLPRAYAAAPLPVAAVLAGALTELGVLGWMRALPVGEAPLDAWGAGLVALGFTAVAYGVALGVTRTTTPAVLAYSSIGQIGLMTAGVGVALARPDLAPAALAGVLVLALHHGIVKGALFIAVGVAAAAPPGRGRWSAFALFAVLALALAGAPVTSGAAAKEALKAAGDPWWAGMEWALAGAAVATALLMWRAVHLVWSDPARGDRLEGPGPVASLTAVTALVLALPLAVAEWAPFSPAAGATAITPASAWSALWPLLIAGAAVAAVTAVGARMPVTPRGPREVHPVTDLVEGAARWSRAGAEVVQRWGARVQTRVASVDPAPLGRALDAVESRIAGIGAGALALGALVLAIVWVLW